MVGTTGTGKSSLIRLYCVNNVVVGHGTASQTQGSTIFKELNSDRHWVDSQGVNDCKGVDDEKVLKDVLKALFDNDVDRVKVIWCVSGDMCRQKKEFKTQAKFIQSLGDNIWNSCLIIKRKGKPKQKS